jgi:hypothetical protein
VGGEVRRREEKREKRDRKKHTHTHTHCPSLSPALALSPVSFVHEILTPWIGSMSILNELADATETYSTCQEVMNHVWRRMKVRAVLCHSSAVMF